MSSGVRAAVVNEIGGGLQIEELILDEPRGREVLVEVRASGLCHSDLSFSEADYGTGVPAVLGHELAGVVLALGPDATGVSVGDHVVGSLVRSCGACPSCTGGAPFCCTRLGELVRGRTDPPRLLSDGDVVEIEIDGVGLLRITVRQA